jgi:cob(I)alamin adenosyltransferase
VSGLRIYTKTGDLGRTSLLGGKRVPKDHPRVQAYGDVDELNAALGAVRAHTGRADLSRLVLGIQRDLLAIGAQLADPSHRVASKRSKAAVSAARVRRLERAIDTREARLPPLRAFVLPGGPPAAAHLHVARAVCRRAERSVVALLRTPSSRGARVLGRKAAGQGPVRALSHEAEIDPRVLVYLNRLSDLLFVLARVEIHRTGEDEERW